MVAASRRLNLCFLCHGMSGSKEDWNTWLEWFQVHCPSWHLKACDSVTKGSAAVIGEGLHKLADLLADEMMATIQELLVEEKPASITLHCVGHSMGGVVFRGALPRVFDQAPDVQAGVFLSLSSPHLGVQASWGAPQDMWRNLAFVLRPLSVQIPQLAIQDRTLIQNQDGTSVVQPYLECLADPEGPHIEALKRFRRRVCVTMGCDDFVIPATSGVLWADRPWTEPVAPPSQVAGWGFQAMSRYVPKDDLIERSASRDAAWRESADSKSWFPSLALDGLLTLSWERIVVQLHLPQAPTTHVFLVGKESDQGLVEHVFSKECVGCLARMLVDAAEGLEIMPLEIEEAEIPGWRRSLGHVVATSRERYECLGKWTVATEEGLDNVKFYPFEDEVSAKQYFEGWGGSSACQLVSRILFDPQGYEVRRAGANKFAFPTILQYFSCPTSSASLDGRWIVGAELGVGNVKYYHFAIEALARHFLANGFNVASRVLFCPQGLEVCRVGLNALAQTSVVRALEESVGILKHTGNQVEASMLLAGVH